MNLIFSFPQSLDICHCSIEHIIDHFQMFHHGKHKNFINRKVLRFSETILLEFLNEFSQWVYLVQEKLFIKILVKIIVKLRVLPEPLLCCLQLLMLLVLSPRTDEGKVWVLVILAENVWYSSYLLSWIDYR